MKEQPMIRVKSFLRDVPNGTMILDLHPGQPSETNLFTGEFQAQTDGSGKLEVYQVFPGIQLSLNTFLADEVSFFHESHPHILEITHCRTGRIGWNFKNGTSVYLGAGDLALQNTGCCAASVMTFPLGYCESVTISVNFTELSRNPLPVFAENGLDTDLLYRHFCLSGKSMSLPSSPDIDCIFRPVYQLPEQLRLPYFQLKVQELLLYLSCLSPEDSALTAFQSRQTALMQQIHHQLTEHLDRRYTIEELSRQYLINTSSLKEIFKGVYGMPIATYMKEYRIHKAMELLTQTNDSIAEIASAVGYETQGKFAKSFKEFTGLTPSTYRKKYREHPVSLHRQTDETL